MSEVIIRAENISKQYRLGQLGTGTISHDLNRWWHKIRGKEDPYLKVGDSNDRSKTGGSDYVWSLKDINFEVKQGDVLGIIGRNGAGKSTLLKILSQVTTPTTGQIKINGRIASLLEVGTGFHPDLSGRENVFLNGAILGMSKSEIKAKLEEIVDFSGVAKYIDTPVKRYSSGMMVRLGFAVAAHLEPEILIVDEVLAVGDAEFQKKCLGKMRDVNRDGRTVLFVSHNMPAIKTICTKGLLIDKGKIIAHDDVQSVVKTYFSSNNHGSVWERSKVDQKSGNRSFYIESICAKQNGEMTSDIKISEPIEIVIRTVVTEENAKVALSLVATDAEGICLFGSLNNLEEVYYGKKMEKGNYVYTCYISGNTFNNIEVYFSILASGANETESFSIENAIRINAVDDGILKADYSGGYGGFFRPKFKWEAKQINS